MMAAETEDFRGVVFVSGGFSDSRRNSEDGAAMVRGRSLSVLARIMGRSEMDTVLRRGGCWGLELEVVGACMAAAAAAAAADAEGFLEWIGEATLLFGAG